MPTYSKGGRIHILSYEHTIKPEVRNILGGSQQTTGQNSKEQFSPGADQTLWTRIKSGVKKAFGLIKQAVDYIKDKIVPIAVAATGLLNAWSTFYHYTENKRRTAWCA